jgi:hypothetical protein
MLARHPRRARLSQNTRVKVLRTAHPAPCSSSGPANMEVAVPNLDCDERNPHLKSAGASPRGRPSGERLGPRPTLDPGQRSRPCGEEARPEARYRAAARGAWPKPAAARQRRARHRQAQARPEAVPVAVLRKQSDSICPPIAAEDRAKVAGDLAGSQCSSRVSRRSANRTTETWFWRSGSLVMERDSARAAELRAPR